MSCWYLCSRTAKTKTTHITCLWNLIIQIPQKEKISCPQIIIATHFFIDYRYILSERLFYKRHFSWKCIKESDFLLQCHMCCMWSNVRVFLKPSYKCNPLFKLFLKRVITSTENSKFSFLRIIRHCQLKLFVIIIL